MTQESDCLPSLLAAVEAHARDTPANVALSTDQQTLTYGQLQCWVTAVASGLHGLGARPGQRIAVLGHKTVRSVVALLAVMRSGCAYVPLDPRAPARRIAQLVEDAGCALVLCDQEAGDRLPAGVRAVSVADAARTPGQPPPRSVADTDIAYCLYTSGSTGRPKGVQIPHRALNAFFRAVHPLLEVTPSARCLNTSALHFDVSVVDVLYPLWRGATVHLGPAVPLPPVLLGLIERHRITHMAAVGSTLSLLANVTDGFRGRDIGSLRRVMTGAEIIDPRTVQAWLAAAPDLVVINGYGPTEATCLVLAHAIGEREPGRTEPYPIGRPLSGVRLRFLKDDGDVCECGPGEILIGGDQVMTGYLARPEEQERAFIEADGTSYYRTGDQGALAADGSVLFRGRRDDEVKHRGYRINLQEINKVLQGHPDVGWAFCGPAVDERGRAVLRCAVVPAGAQAEHHDAGSPTASAEPLPEPERQTLRDHLARQLPAYMVPDHFVRLPVLPVLSSGKPDTARIRGLLDRAGQGVGAV